MNIFRCLIIALAYCNIGSTSEQAETVAVNSGEPFILNFGYSGPTVGISHDLTKDGIKVTVDNTRTFKQLGKLYFTETNELDSGEYHLAVNGNGVDFRKNVILSG